ncbi:methylglyoxal reductase (NADPH-dependent) gre2 [Tulasnella sp. JGI-2019a]|nr:methylglyoxal reductase (NADPH-dependent) gre2 [Tulasnella sp. JGI-2019a]
MPAIKAPATVLVTGASGFIAASCCQELLKRGFNVRGTVRSKEKGEYLAKVFENEPGKFEYVIVEDMQAPNAYDEAVRGVDAVEHVASPLSSGLDGEPEQALRPAINGTLGVLESLKKHAPGVKRVVVTSSMAAIGRELTPSSWNQAAVDELNKSGKAASRGTKYSASKVLAERAAWEFVEKNRGEIGFDLVTICPALVGGPNIQEGGISQSCGLFLSALDPKNRKKGSELTARWGSYCDVRDIAAMHADALMKPGAGGERLIATAGPFNWQMIYEALGVPFEEPAEKAGPLASADNSRTSVVLEKPLSEIFRPLAETLNDTVGSARERGWDVKYN